MRAFVLLEVLRARAKPRRELGFGVEIPEAKIAKM
jgi:hypothetical protein